MARPGVLVVSLDFELYWGMRDATSLARYGANLLGERRVVPRLLDLFAAHGVHATWATVGFLYFETRAELLRHLPETRPRYERAELSPYPHLASVGDGERDDPFHFGASLLDLVRAAPGQEIGTHTFSHYYALERGQDASAFRADLEAALAVARAHGDAVESIVFPRNQVNDEYLGICAELGLRAYRGTERSWFYRSGPESESSLVRRGARLVDAYAPLSAHNAYPRDTLDGGALVNVPSSRFLRPYSRRLRALEPLRVRRILGDLTHAARHGLVYHLWWHPHNFGVDTEQNLRVLRTLLARFDALRERYGMESMSMGELARSARA